MTQKKRFCKDCKNFRAELYNDYTGRLHNPDMCLVALITFDPVQGEVKTPSDPLIKNSGLDCPDWVPLNGEWITRGNISDEKSKKTSHPEAIIAVAAAIIFVIVIVSVLSRG